MCNFSDYVYNTGYETGVTSGSTRRSKGERRYSWSNRFIKRRSRGRRYQSENHEENSLTSEQAVNYMNRKYGIKV